MSFENGILTFATDYTIGVDKLTAEVLFALAQLGGSTALKNSHAGLAKALKTEGKTDEEVAAATKAKMDEKFQAILSGTLRVASGTRAPRAVDAAGKIRTQVIKSMLEAFAAAKKVTLPKGEALAAIREKFVAKRTAEIEAEVARRMALQAVVSDDEDDDIFADMDEGDTNTDTESQAA